MVWIFNLISVLSPANTDPLIRYHHCIAPCFSTPTFVLSSSSSFTNLTINKTNSFRKFYFFLFSVNKYACSLINCHIKAQIVSYMFTFGFTIQKMLMLRKILSQYIWSSTRILWLFCLCATLVAIHIGEISLTAWQWPVMFCPLITWRLIRVCASSREHKSTTLTLTSSSLYLVESIESRVFIDY